MTSSSLTDCASLLQVFQTEPEQRAAVLDLMMQAFENGDFQLQWEVGRVLCEIGAPAIRPLVALMQDDDHDLELRWMAARTLGELECPEVIPPLVELLCSSGNSDLQEMAAAALTNLGDQAVAPLTQLLDGPWQLAVVKALAQIRTRAIVEPLLRVVQAEDPQVRACAIEALSSFHDSRIPAVLVQASQDPDVQVRTEAVTGLSLRSDLALELDLLDLFTEALSDPALEVSCCAATALGRMGNIAAARLAAHLERAALPVQREILRALGRIASSEAITYLEQAADSRSVAVVREGISVLGRLGASMAQDGPNSLVCSQVTPVLLKALQHPDLEVKKLAAIGLAQIDDPAAVEPLVQCLAEPEPAVRLHIIAALEKIDRTGAQQMIEQRLRQEGLDPIWQEGLQAFLREELDRELRASGS
ncbi:HEAT repeat domain-containing protein [Leptolyngbya sp. FACHB-261]|uniref:HEAT repeat domain-containing protein n=1 Tax=Leptolyngbya sp. FACHB-261 TaxID=2692806 RepID=UPI001689F31E|nr:HEAT repeat domain-containing protein [Leptolyngbya sp. FACHB-261]MBD2104136.1 HEAT repeat domain-containing protein [Leptolyngbya sp. FACHB-261]